MPPAFCAVLCIPAAPVPLPPSAPLSPLLGPPLGTFKVVLLSGPGSPLYLCGFRSLQSFAPQSPSFLPFPALGLFPSALSTPCHLKALLDVSPSSPMLTALRQPAQLTLSRKTRGRQPNHPKKLYCDLCTKQQCVGVKSSLTSRKWAEAWSYRVDSVLSAHNKLCT